MALLPSLRKLPDPGPDPETGTRLLTALAVAMMFGSYLSWLLG